MTGISHVDAVEVLKSITDKCHLVVSREVLIVLPEDITSPPPTGATGDKMVAFPAPEGQPDKVKTPPPVQSKNASSPPPEGQVSKTSPPPAEDQVDKVSPPPQGQTDADITTTTTLTVPSVVQSKSTEELHAFEEQLTQVANAAIDQERIFEEVVEELLEGAPQLENQPDDSVEDKQLVELKEDNQTGVEVDDLSALEEFADQLQRAKEQEIEEEMMNINVDDVGSLPRDNYVNYDIAQAIITSHSNESLANSEEDSSGGVTCDPHANKNKRQSDNIEVVNSEPVVVEPAATEPAVVKSEEVEVKKSEPKFVPPVTEEVVLSQGTGPLGMNIVGGIDRSSFPFGKGLPGVFISKVCLLFVLIRQ